MLKVKKPFLLLLSFLFFIQVTSFSQTPEIKVIEVKGMIDPVSANFVEQSIKEAEKEFSECLIIKLDTPGGLDTSMRQIVEVILNSKIPIVVYVTPSGARAASAGVFITLAANISVMTPGTNIGAAHPVDFMGQKVSDKIVNDAAAYIKTIAKKRGKNTDWAEKAVRKSLSITDDEALKLKVIDLLCRDIEELKSKIDGKTVETSWGAKVLRTKDAVLDYKEMSWGWKFMHEITKPTIAYLLFLIGFYGIIYELLNPGAILPGIVGGICLILSFFALESLPVNITGILLIVFAIILFIADIKIPGYGMLTVGGIISLVLGSFMFFSGKSPYLRIPFWEITTVSVITAAFFTFAVGAGIRAQRKKITSGTEGLIGTAGIVQTDLAPEGIVHIGGEDWKATSLSGEIKKGEKVVVRKVEGLVLEVEKLA